MAGGIHIFNTPTTGQFVLKVQPDKEYDLMEVSERFEVPYLEPKTLQGQQNYYNLIKVMATQTAKHAIYTYERLRHWKFYDKKPIQLDESQAQYDLDIFRSSRNIDHVGVNQGSLIDEKGKVAYVVKLWFVVPKFRVEVIKPEVNDEDVTDGLVNPYNIFGYNIAEAAKAK